MNTYGEKNWEYLWEQLEQQGNVGIDYVINPVLYSKITEYLGNHSKSVVVDYGCGTNIMGIQLLFGHKDSIPALKNESSLHMARFNTLLYIGLEGSEELVHQSNKYLKDIGGPRNIGTVLRHIESDEEMFDSSSINLCTSRNFLMHLSNESLQNHFNEVHRILKQDGQYIFATLNPDYERTKTAKQIQNGDPYGFTHGKEGEFGTFYHYFREKDYFEEIIGRSGLQIVSETVCMPITDSFKNTHSRYYNEVIPMARVYVLRK